MGIKLRSVALLLFISQLLSCHYSKKNYQFATGAVSTSCWPVGDIISKVVKKENGINLHVIDQDSIEFTLTALNNVKLMLQNRADFAIAQNDVQLHSHDINGTALIKDGICSMMPLYPQIFLIIYKGIEEPKSLHELIIGQKIGMGPEESGTTKFAKSLLSEFDITPGMYTPVYRDFAQNVFSDSINIVCVFTGFNNPRIEALLDDGGQIFSFDNPQLAGSGSSIDGFCLNYPLARPYVLPRLTYGDRPKKPALTTAVDAVLLVKSSVDDDVVYDVMKTIVEQKHNMAMISKNDLISQITEHFAPSSLRFPLHPGAQSYLDRDAPSLLERYAESAAFIFTIVVTLIGALGTLARWRKMRSKNRIDVYYQEVLAVEKSVLTFNKSKQCEIAESNLRTLRDNAFRQLIAEKLTADESFRIFITLLNDTIREIRRKQRFLENKG